MKSQEEMHKLNKMLTDMNQEIITGKVIIKNKINEPVLSN